MQTQNQDELRAIVKQFSDGLAKKSDQLTQWCRDGGVDARALIRQAQLTVSRDSRLHDPRSWPSVFYSLITAAQLGLEANGFLGDGWIIARWDKKAQCNLASFQPGYKGLLKLIRRSGEVKQLRSYVVLEGDEIDVRFDARVGRYDVDHRINLADRGTEVVAAFSVAHLADGSIDVEIVDRASIDKARRAGHGDTPAWKTWPDQMARKVALRRHCNQLPMSPIARRALALDTAIAINDGERLEDLRASDPDDPGDYIDVNADHADRPQLAVAPSDPEPPPRAPEPAMQPARAKAEVAPAPDAAPPPAASTPAAEALKDKVRKRRQSKAKTDDLPPIPPPPIPPPDDPPRKAPTSEADYLREEVNAGRITDDVRARVRALEGDVKVELVLLIDAAAEAQS
jgi:recombination protein RecT